jgi:hypothetical protein
MIDENEYVDVLKALEFGGEGGSESLYRLLPYGEANFTWRTYGSGGVDDEESYEDDYINEYESLTAYLLDSSDTLSGFVPLYIDAQFRDEVFAAFLKSIRSPTMFPRPDIFTETDFYGWPLWQKIFNLRPDYETITVYSAFGPNPIMQLRFAYEEIKNVQILLNCIYNAVVVQSQPPNTYGKRWLLYDLVNCRPLVLPRDDRADRLFEAGLKQGGQWVVYATD